MGLRSPINASSFNLAEIGTYQVLFEVSVSEPGQLILTLNGADLAYTVFGRATGTSQIEGMALVQTSVINSVLTVRNPAGNAAALTITPLAGRYQAGFRTSCYYADCLEGKKCLIFSMHDNNNLKPLIILVVQNKVIIGDGSSQMQAAAIGLPGDNRPVVQMIRLASLRAMG